MTKLRVRTFSSLAVLAWLVLGGYGIWEIVAEDSGDNWETPYLIFNVALFLSVLLTTAAVWTATRSEKRSPMRLIGWGVCALGLFFALAGAWALPAWMTLFAIGYGLIALSGASRPWRLPVACLAASQVAGMVALFVAAAAEVGRSDEYGDHPAAFGISLVVTVAGSLISMYLLDRSVATTVAVAGQSNEAVDHTWSVPSTTSSTASISAFGESGRGTIHAP
jgi:hypothetical protein